MDEALKQKCRMYEQPALSKVTGETLRPGGIELTSRMIEYCNFNKNAKIIDVGCGTGISVEHLINNYNLDAVGIDPSPLLIERGLKRNPKLQLKIGRAESLPFNDNAVDGILTECTLSLVDDLKKALYEFNRVLKNKGYLMISDIYLRNLIDEKEMSSLPIYSCLNGASAKDELIKKIESCGFKIVLWEDCTGKLKSLMAQIIMKEGSLANFWSKFIPNCQDCNTVKETIYRSKPGYFLLIAQKNLECNDALE